MILPRTLVVFLYLSSWASLVAQTVRKLSSMWETQVWSGVEDPTEKKMATHPKWLPTPVFSREFHEERSLVGYSHVVYKESDMAEQLMLSFSSRAAEKAFGKPSRVSSLEDQFNVHWINYRSRTNNLTWDLPTTVSTMRNLLVSPSCPCWHWLPSPKTQGDVWAKIEHQAWQTWVHFWLEISPEVRFSHHHQWVLKMSQACEDTLREVCGNG